MVMNNVDDIVTLLAKGDITAEELANDFAKNLNEAVARMDAAKKAREEEYEKQKLADAEIIVHTLVVFLQKYYNDFCKNIAVTNTDETEFAKEIIANIDAYIKLIDGLSFLTTDTKRAATSVKDPIMEFLKEYKLM